MPLPVASSAPRVKKALKEHLEAEKTAGNTKLAGVQIAYAHPGAFIQQEAIFFARTMLDEDAAALGRKRRDENYIVELVVDIVQDGDDPETAESRCWEVVAAIEEILRPIPELPSATEPTGTVSGWVVFRGAELTPYPMDGQRLAECVCKIAVFNRK